MQRGEYETTHAVGYESLANAIVEQAVNDYRSAARVLAQTANDPDSISNSLRRYHALRGIKEIEEFFTSRWCGTLTAVDGKWMLHKLRRETRIKA
jgi:hypothetical protein